MVNKTIRAGILAFALGASLALTPFAAAAAVPVGVNLLEKPGHEHPGAYFGGRGELNVTWGWVPFWQEPPPGTDLRDQNYRTPEFRPTFARDYPYRVWSGAGSDHWFNYSMTGKIWTSVGPGSTTPTLTYTAPSVPADASPLTSFTFQVEDDGNT